jgi:hypothetical protein
VGFALRFLMGYNNTAAGDGGSSGAGSSADAGAVSNGTSVLDRHRLLEAAKHGFALRMWLGDPGTAERPQADAAAVLEVRAPAAAAAGSGGMQLRGCVGVWVPAGLPACAGACQARWLPGAWRRRGGPCHVSACRVSRVAGVTGELAA